MQPSLEAQLKVPEIEACGWGAMCMLQAAAAAAAAAATLAAVTVAVAACLVAHEAAR